MSWKTTWERDGWMFVFIIFVVVVTGFIFVMQQLRKKEHYRDPIYLNQEKYKCDLYPRSNGSIYGLFSHLLSGFPYYNKAY